MDHLDHDTHFLELNARWKWTYHIRFLLIHIYHNGHSYIYESDYFTTYLFRRSISELGLIVSNRTVRSLCAGSVVDIFGHRWSPSFFT